MATTRDCLGFTELHNPPSPVLDIVFVHGLQGHPRKTWTYFDRKAEGPGANNAQEGKRERIKQFFGLGSRNPATPSDSESIAAAPTAIDGGAGGTRPDVFWPEDLLPKLEECKQARILTYGYDSRLVVLVRNEKVNFSDISSQGETLLNGLASVRADCNDRPLMFVAHSLGGLLVKIDQALNNSRSKSTISTDKDIYDIFKSTFAILFFGTPHRGSSMADFGRSIIKIAAAVTLTPYNPNTIKSLDTNNEILRLLRKAFFDTLEDLINRNKFESSTFQETQGISNVPGLRGKVVEDDSSELERNNRNFHIEADHRRMCRFSGSDDPGYKMVIGEIKRHIGRLWRQTKEEEKELMSSLEKLGLSASERMKTVEERTDGTLEWLFTAAATQPLSPNNTTPGTLGSWLSGGNGIFWITGIPGSGKSTSMRHLYESPRTLELLETPSSPQEVDAQPRSSTKMTYNGRADYDESNWKRIGLFITNFGGQPEQRKWETMLHGFLLQLLRSRQDLKHLMMKFIRDVERDERHLGKGIANPHYSVDWTAFQWSSKKVQQAMEYCVKNSGRPLRVLVIVDGLDELEDDDSACEAAQFLETLAEDPITSSAFRICAASRPEQRLQNVFVNAPRIEIHHHTKEDIRQHAWSLLRQNDNFRNKPEEDAKASLGRLLDYIVRNAEGVFLWANSIASLANDELNHGASAEDLHLKMEKLPKTMDDLYRRLLDQVKPKLRLKAFIALEVVLRLGKPTLETVFHCVQETEIWLKERSGASQIPRKPFNNDVSQETLRQFRGQLAISCRCMLRFSQDKESVYKSISAGQSADSLITSFAHQEVSLLHASAKEFLLRLDFPGILVPQDSPGKPIGNGHGYYLLYARSWLKSMKRAAFYKNLRCIDIVLEQSPRLNTAAEDYKAFFEILDDIDDTATSIFGESWPGYTFQQAFGVNDPGYKFLVPSFLAWAVANGTSMHKYVVYRISQQDNRTDFINNRYSRQNAPPLLQFTCGSLEAKNSALWRYVSPLMWPVVHFHNFHYLIEQGADIFAILEGRASLPHERVDRWQYSFPVTSYLLAHGLDPNLSVRLYETWCPFLHVVVCLDGATLFERLDTAAILLKHGVGFNKPDENMFVLAEKLFCASGHFPPDRWAWVLESGARITKSMVCSKDSLWSCDIPGEKFAWSVDEVSRKKADILVPRERAGICDDLGPGRLRHDAWDILRLPEFRRREWYTEEAAELAEEMVPGWFMAGESGQTVESEQIVATGILQTRRAWWNFGLPWRG